MIQTPNIRCILISLVSSLPNNPEYKYYVTTHNFWALVEGESVTFFAVVNSRCWDVRNIMNYSKRSSLYFYISFDFYIVT